MKSELQGLASKEVAASRSRGRGSRARESNRLAALERCAPVDTPTADQLIGESARAGHKVFALAERKLVSAAKVEHMADVERSQAVISLDSEAWNIRSTIAIYIIRSAVVDTTAVEQVVSIGEHLRKCVGADEVQAAGELLFEFELKRMIVTVSLGLRKTRASSEVRERNKQLRIEAGTIRILGGQDLSNIVGARKDLKMPGHRVYVSGLERHRRRQLILHGEIAAHRIRRNVIELDPQESQSIGVNQQRIEWCARESGLKCSGEAGTCRGASWECDRRILIRLREVELELERIVFADVWRISAVLKAIVENAPASADDQLCVGLVCETDARSEIGVL